MVRSLIVAISVPWLAIAPTEMVRRLTQPAKGARITRSPICAWTACACARAAAAAATWRVVIGAGGEAAILERLDPLELLLRLALARIGRVELGVLLGLAQHRDDLAALDEAAVVEIEPDDPLGDRRRQGHLLVGARGADRLDPVGEAIARRRLGLDQRRLAVALLGVAAAAGGERDREHEDEKLPVHA